jgi:cytochrome c peroxidase
VDTGDEGADASGLAPLVGAEVMKVDMRTVCGALLVMSCAAPPALQPTPLGLDAFIAAPATNPTSARAVALGRRLFFDPALSSDRSVSCATCHRPEHAFSDTVALSFGVGGRRGRRNAPTVINRAYARSLFWDGRVSSLEEQVLHPIQDSLEMALPLDELLVRLAGDARYRSDFQRAFGEAPTTGNVARALASYLRTLRVGNAPVDRYRAGDTTALSSSARRGLTLFLGRANCARCHVGSNFTDEEFHDTGIAWRGGALADSGRYEVTHDARHLGAFKTPTLREAACTAPYMHDGSIATLEEVVDFYDRGGHPNPYLDDEIRPLRLSTQDRRDLVLLLIALGGDCSRR